MAEFPYWADNWFATHQIKKNFANLRQRVTESRADSVADLRSVLESVDQLETDIGRTLLKLHALVDVLVEKGIVQNEELAAKARELDTLDGQQDGILHPAIFRTNAEQQKTPSTRVYLQRLEQQTVSPKEFLSQLESQTRD
jgi:hypothetical protein